MAIQKQFVLRYRKEGHVRFEIPVQFCDVDLAEKMTEKLLARDGVYSVKIFRSQKKLSIRYQEAFCDFSEVTRLLFQVVADLEKQASRIGRVQKAGKAEGQGNDERLGITGWFSRKYGDAKETLQAARILTKAGLSQKRKLINDPEKALIDFFNDVLALFLIRLHWDHITKDWIPRPFKHRYEWLAVFYMIFLLMRSRRPR